MKRRALVTAGSAFAALACAGRLLAQAKQAPVLIGWLNMASRESGGHWLTAFKQGLAEFGWKEGLQYVVEERWAAGRIERLQPLAEELAVKKPVLIVAAPSQSVAAASKAAPKIPIVHATGSDPVYAGFAKSLARPGGMITGLSNVVADLSEKYLELLLAVAPKLRRVGFLMDSTNFARIPMMEGARRSVGRQAIEARFEEIAKPEEVEPALSRLAKERVQALVAMPSPMFGAERKRIIALAQTQHWPVIAWSREWAADGALLSYGVDTAANFRRAAYYADRILKGANPAELPIEQPFRIELVVNLKTAKALGIAIPQTLLVRADEVIQ